MKILRISLRNIASLEGTHTVDFTRDPLRSAGLFSISGITGSGKSTLLDVLCLALYEKTPRLHTVRSLVKLSDGSGTISQKDPANLLRRGTAEGFAEVAFMGVDNIAYTARWTIRRARNRPDGALQNSEMILFRGDVPPGTSGTIEQGGKKTEVLALIQAKVGLSFEQFTRAVLLAQNDFATFLKADDKERAEILQALTGTERFEAISIAVFNRCSAESRAVAEIEDRLAGNAPLSPEGRLEAEATCARTEATWKEAREKLAAKEAHAAWHRRFAEISTQVDAASASLREKIAVRDSAAPRRLELQHTEEVSRGARRLRDDETRTSVECLAAEKSHAVAVNSEKAAQASLAGMKTRYSAADSEFAAAKLALENAKPHLLEARKLDAELAPLAARLDATKRDREEAEAELRRQASKLEEHRLKRAAAEKERASLVPRRDALAAFSPFVPEAAAWIQRLDLAASRRQALGDANAAFALRVREEKARIDAANSERAKEAAVRKVADDTRTALEQAENAMREHDGERIARARREAEAARTDLLALEKHLQQLDSHAQQASALEAAIAKLAKENEADATTLNELREKRIPDAQKTSNAARRAFELAEAAVTDAAANLREKLVEGAPCPVCGATNHPHSAHPPPGEAAALRALRSDCAAREADLQNLRENAAALDATRTARLAQESATASELAVIRARLPALRSAIFEGTLAKAILSFPDGDRAAALVAQLDTQQKALAAIEAADSARRDAETRRDGRRAERDRAAAALEALERNLAKFAAELSALQAAREAAANARTLAEAEFQKCSADLQPLAAALSGSCGIWSADIATFRKKFADGTNTLLGLEKRVGELAGMVREVDAALVPANESFARAQANEAAKRSAEAGALSCCEAVRVRRAALLGGRAAHAMEAELTEAARRTAETRDLRAGESEKANRDLAASAEALKAAGKTLAESNARHAAAKAALDSWLAAFHAQTGRALERAQLEKILGRDESWIKTERFALDAMEGAIRTAEGVLTVHKTALDEHTAGRPATDDEATVAAALAELRAACDEASRLRDEARAFLLADDQRIKDNAELSRRLGERRALADPWLKLNELVGSSDGAKFRSIAQRRTLDILLGYANAQLDQLASRYRLERLPESLNLVVIDRDMGDERRSVHSLSGGESFLVSLALALALASLTSNRLRIESLFIDEGFGSLDTATLNTAMNALMHLEAQGRKVGVISHVAEMADAIPVQIRVVKGRSGSSKLIVPGVPDSESSFPPQTDDAARKISARILEILRREQAVGDHKVSVRSLREEIGCDHAVFLAAREALAGQVRLEGRSLLLA